MTAVWRAARDFDQEVSPVLSKCANPACLSRLHYLREGRIFKIETSPVASDRSPSSTRKIEYFWLCARCVKSLEVVVENGVVTTRPLHLQLAKSASREDSEGKRQVA
jgi:hypothetical protein